MSRDEIDAYFRRIGYEGPRDPDLALLKAIQAGHTATIPFENLDVLLGRPIRLDIGALQQKLVHDRRGGYCFEQNGLLAHVLRSLGYRVTPLAARVRWNVPAETETALSHMLLKVDLPEGPYLVDVGFGRPTPGAPLGLVAGFEQPTSLGTYRLVDDQRDVELQIHENDRWVSLYRFTLEPRLAVDYEVANWYVSTHPKSNFVLNLVAARQAGDRRFILFNDQFSIRRTDGVTEDWSLRGPEELLQILWDYFGIDPASLGDEAAVHAALARIMPLSH